MCKVSIANVIADFDGLEDNSWGFYDWFCSSSSLERRAKSFKAKLSFLVKEGLIDGEINYPWFKNNAPWSGGSYDDCRISSLNRNNDFLGGFCPKSPNEKGAHIWMLNLSKDELDKIEENDAWSIEYGYLVFYADNWSALKKELKSNKELRRLVKLNFNS